MNPPLANILLVDDRAEDRAALEVVLAPLGQNLILAESGQDALRHLLKTEFALILLDVEMPLMDGLETAGMIRQRERSQQIPIIFITGVAVTGVERFKGYAAGAVDYMLKPVIPDVLRWKVRVFVDLYRLKAAREEQIRALEVANQAQSPVQFLMDPIGQWKAFEWIESNGLELLGIFHSHPAGPTVGSPTDLANAAYAVVHIILSRVDGPWRARAGWR